jgi:pimeloyl-ACP methyl ester carboxylesterase
MKTFQNDAGATLSYHDVGHGHCVLALHGAYSTHHELASALEPMLARYDTYRRLYPDLPGMGASPPNDSTQSSNDVIDLLEQFVDDQIGDGPLLVIGQSYGAHLARGLAARRPRQVVGLALICPLMPEGMNPEPQVVVQSDVDPTALLDPSHVDDFLGYFVVHTDETVRRFKEAVVPSLGRFDGEAVERIMSEWRLDPDPDELEFHPPALIVTGRNDSTVGYRQQMSLIDRYLRSSFFVLAGTGHALPHERSDLLSDLIDDWLALSTASLSDGADSA